MKPEDYGYVLRNNICLFQKGPLSQWWGGFAGQNGGFEVDALTMSTFNSKFLDMIGVDLKDSTKYKIRFNCCEQWMMAHKAIMFGDIASYNKIKMTTSPQEQKDLGRQVSNFVPSIWDERAVAVVEAGNIKKFTQNQELCDFLLSFPDDTIFAEASPWDKIWGIGMGPDDKDAGDITKWKGSNKLGKVITKIRDTINDPNIFC